MELIVSIIGFGNIGKAVGALLLPIKGVRLHINIIDTNWNVYGAILDLEHGAELYPHHQIAHNSEALLNESDFIFHCAGASVPKGKSRLVTCQESITITKAIFESFSSNKQPFIIVVANPVEIIACITQKLTGLPASHVLGTGTFLDTLRMNYMVKQSNPNVDSINAILLGEHGTTAFFSEQLSTINGQAFSAYFDNDTLNDLLISVKASAAEIKETQKATIYGVSFCVIRIFESLLSETGHQLPVSTFIPEYLRLLLEEEATIYLSLYSLVNHKGAQPVETYQPSNHEIACLKNSVDLIKKNMPAKYYY